MARDISPFYLEWVRHENGVYTPTNEIDFYGVNLLAIRRKGTSLENHGNAQDIVWNEMEDDSANLISAVTGGAYPYSQDM